jgi:dihydropteroate synthase
MERVLPVIEAILRARPGALLSIDTYHAATARAAVEAGAEIVNDVSGLLWDGEMAATCAALGCGVVAMHTRGRPAEWASLPALPPAEVVPTVARGLAAQRDAALSAGIAPARLVLDPGFGFGKRGAENYTLLMGLGSLAALGHPLLAGLSRKGFLGRASAGGAPVPAPQRDTATVAAGTIAILMGASLLRVHCVARAMEAAAVADAALAAAGDAGAVADAAP